MADKVDAQFGRVPGVPLLLEWKDAQQQIHVALELAGAGRPRCPDLRRNVLNNPGFPVGKCPPARADISLYGVDEAAIEPGEIHADDQVRLACQGELKEPVEEAFELRVLPQGIRQSDD